MKTHYFFLPSHVLNSIYNLTLLAQTMQKELRLRNKFNDIQHRIPWSRVMMHQEKFVQNFETKFGSKLASHSIQSA